jgi:Na+/H+-dicarboxylate symporter
MGHTTLNVSGDVVGALLVAKSENLLSTEKVASPTTTPATPATSSTPAVSVD